MNLLDIVHRDPLAPWAEGEKIPWNEPGFSSRMLREHLSQAHDAASRRGAKIDATVAWIHEELLRKRPARVLDLGCGPGLYTSRLARLGHECVGVDFGPASITYAVRTAQEEGLSCRYVEGDLRTAEYGAGYALAMWIYGEFNVFRPAEAQHILDKAYRALDAGGRLLLEPSTWEAVQRAAQAGPSWYAVAEGLFSERPHLCLEEQAWDAQRAAHTTRYYIVDALTGEVTRHASTEQAYSEEQLAAMLAACGFEEVRFLPMLPGGTEGLCAVVARKGSRCVKS
jgi:SAM-dependent methyltransferase